MVDFRKTIVEYFCIKSNQNQMNTPRPKRKNMPSKEKKVRLEPLENHVKVTTWNYMVETMLEIKLPE
jgi:hypothetical protein